MTDRTRSTGSIVAASLFAWLLDFPVFLAAFVLWLLLMYWGLPFLTLVPVALVAALVWWFVRNWEAGRRRRRRFVRAWKGTQERDGLAAVLGLANKSGAVPRLRTYEIEAGSRTFEFSLVPGVTSDDFEQVAAKFADSVGAHRAQVTKAGPGVVRVRVVDVDSMTVTREAQWAKGIQISTHRDDMLPNGSRPWYERTEDEAD